MVAVLLPPMHPAAGKGHKVRRTVKEQVMATTTARRAAGRDSVSIYLNDHLAGATAGMELARRMTAAAEPGSPTAATLRQVTAEIVEDRQSLIAMMGALGVPVRGYKVFAAWAGEKAGRLKPNGHLLTRSPLSQLEETELMLLGVAGKAAGWRALRQLAERDGRLDAGRLGDLIARADRQAGTLEKLRTSIVADLVSDEPA